MIDNLYTLTGNEAYYNKTAVNETVKINAATIQMYRERERCLYTIHHTYQIRVQRANTVVIRHYPSNTRILLQKLENSYKNKPIQSEK